MLSLALTKTLCTVRRLGSSEGFKSCLWFGRTISLMLYWEPLVPFCLALCFTETWCAWIFLNEKAFLSIILWHKRVGLKVTQLPVVRNKSTSSRPAKSLGPSCPVRACSTLLVGFTACSASVFLAWFIPLCLAFVSPQGLLISFTNIESSKHLHIDWNLKREISSNSANHWCPNYSIVILLSVWFF